MGIKISQLTPKGSNLSSTDLIEISQLSGSTYISKSITGQQIMNAASAGLTVGTTAIGSGTNGRVLFQAGGVLQQDAAFFWDNTNKRLGIGATPSTSVRLDVRAQGALSTDLAFRVRNSANSANLASIAGNGEFILRNNANNNYLFWDSVSIFQIGTSLSHSCSVQSIANVSSISTTSNRMAIASSSHALDIFKDGNFQFEEISGTTQTSGKGAISLKNAAVIPSANTADRFMFYSADIVAGNAAPHFRTENGNIIKLYQETTGVASATFASGGGGTNMKTDDTFDGYTLQQVVKALRNTGLLA